MSKCFVTEAFILKVDTTFIMTRIKYYMVLALKSLVTVVFTSEHFITPIR